MQGIHITGASGSGVTTLGRALAERLGAAQLDTDAFYWLPTDPPFRERRPIDERLALLRQAFSDSRLGWVLSGSLDGWGDPLIPLFERVFFIYTPNDVRMARLMARERMRYGDRVDPGGAMHDHYLEFVTWAEGYDRGDRPGRSLPRHEFWLAALPCPVVRLDGTLSVEALADLAIATLPPSA